MGEMRESMKIIEQAIENMPAGPVNVDSQSDVVLPAKPAVYRSIEGLIQHFEVLMPNRGYDVPCEEIYAATESPNGELGFYIVADGNGAGVSGPHAAAVVYPLRHVSAHDPRLPVERRGGGAGEYEHHCGGTGSIEELTQMTDRRRRLNQLSRARHCVRFEVMPVLTEEIRNRIRAEFPKYPNKRAVTLPCAAHRA